MLRDVFYFNEKPNAHPREKLAKSLEDARQQCTTEHFWIINEYCDYTNFDWDWDFDFLADEDIWSESHNNIWPSLYAKDSGTWLCSKNNSDILVYRADVQPLAIKKAAPDNTIKKYYITSTIEDLIKQHPGETFWALNSDIDYTRFNFHWLPENKNLNRVYAFVSTQTYFVNGDLTRKGFENVQYINDLEKTPSVTDIFFVDRGNPESGSRYQQLKTMYGDRIQFTRYANSWVDTIHRCANKSRTKLCWVVDSELEYISFDFDFYPNLWQTEMFHVFGSQWSQYGTTFLLNSKTFSVPNTKLVEHISNMNFVGYPKVSITDCLYDVVLIDHGNKEYNEVLATVETKTKRNVVTIKYDQDYLTTFKNLLAQLPVRKEHYIWICSSICDYTKFDFTYVCDPFERTHLHTFPSNKQKYGDTFLVSVNKLRSVIDSLADLDSYDELNFNSKLSTIRYSPPIIVSDETHLHAIHSEYDFPYAMFKTRDNVVLPAEEDEPMALWKKEQKEIKCLSTGSTVIIAPKEASNIVKHELYDYPYLNKSSSLVNSRKMDVVFMSNKETGAEERYKLLAKAMGRAPKRVNGVKGRENAIRKCAEISDTDWVLVVPAKLEIDSLFPFDWQPDRLQEAKHYIFYATNPVNGLCYGHMAPVLYNKRLVLETTAYGLDFTMSKKHAVIEINSGIAHYNLDPLMTWRTAFREVLKLKHAGDTDSLGRLAVWLTVANGLNAEYSTKGANDAVDYYNEVNGDPVKLQLSFDWAWLQERFNLSS